MTKQKFSNNIQLYCKIAIGICAILAILYASTAKAGLYGWGASLENGRQNKVISALKERIDALERRVNRLEIDRTP